MPGNFWRKKIMRFIQNCCILLHIRKTYDGIHRISFLIDADGKIEHVFDDFKTSNHHDVVLNWLKEHA